MKVKKALLLFTLLFIYINVMFAQIGISTDTPMSLLDIGAKFFISDEGNIGIGESQPKSKLTIKNAVPSIIINDGYQIDGHVLTSIDNTGLAVWREPKLDTEIVSGTIYPDNTAIITPRVQVSAPIHLGEGTWLILAKYSARNTMRNNNNSIELIELNTSSIISAGGAYPEQDGWLWSFPQTFAIVKVNAGDTRSFYIAATSSCNCSYLFSTGIGSFFYALKILK